MATRSAFGVAWALNSATMRPTGARHSRLGSPDTAASRAGNDLNAHLFHHLMKLVHKFSLLGFPVISSASRFFVALASSRL